MGRTRVQVVLCGTQFFFPCFFFSFLKNSVFPRISPKFMHNYCSPAKLTCFLPQTLLPNGKTYLRIRYKSFSCDIQHAHFSSPGMEKSFVFFVLRSFFLKFMKNLKVWTTKTINQKPKNRRSKSSHRYPLEKGCFDFGWHLAPTIPIPCNHWFVWFSSEGFGRILVKKATLLFQKHAGISNPKKIFSWSTFSGWQWTKKDM